MQSNPKPQPASVFTSSHDVNKHSPMVALNVISRRLMFPHQPLVSDALLPISCMPMPSPLPNLSTPCRPCHQSLAEQRSLRLTQRCPGHPRRQILCSQLHRPLCQPGSPSLRQHCEGRGPWHMVYYGGGGSRTVFPAVSTTPFTVPPAVLTTPDVVLAAPPATPSTRSLAAGERLSVVAPLSWPLKESLSAGRFAGHRRGAGLFTLPGLSTPAFLLSSLA